ncbi:hypothetical protein [Bifidobacterium longum]|uniref:hypothetical protein n=1 Tax=Bifidobacterium longum TaxID=216816 RepID=UPI0018D1B926|nr:hypothetical protein [Bifidobacterium longum]MBH0364325.1 hypothetical protein [Bifidobacterium longum]MBM5830237.1 hypothetical protein [Bifidobacterium longum subsp. suillum]QSG86906.1 hypothetical protein BLS995_09990 [Bifidobacterium longum subsp. suillum]QSG86929.1 hypothetical protein BLS995_00040 [Bifidobacterium longum subsp. suillum]QXT31359.1 hypothetical protein BLS605_00870 [Bifidobacterium longum subsp. suillum]
MANPDKFLRLRDYARLERAQKNGVVDGTKFAYDSAKHVVSNVREYFDAHRDGRTYGVRFPLYSFSNSPDGVKVGDNAGLTVVPSTNYRAGRDDYACLSAFRVFDANVAAADDGTPVVKAIKGLAGNYAKDGSNGDVFVITTPGFYRFEFDANHCTIWYSDTQYDGYSPMPGALLPDGSLRPCMAYAKYPLSDYGGKAASVSGQIPASMSEQGSVAVTTSKGKGYSGKTSADTFYMQLMHMLKYATKGIERYLGGDFNGSAQVNVSKAGTNVTCALVKATDAASIDLGSYVSVGTGTDRGSNTTGEAAAYRKVISKTVVDAATTAINVSGAAFTTTTAMHVTQMPYLTGSTDGVLGNDGIPREDVPKTHQPIKLQGIELFAGIYETEGDIILNNVKDSDTSGHTEVWKVFDTTKASGTAITADYVHVGDYPAVNDRTDNQWQWQTDFVEKHGFLLPTGVGATSTSGLTDALIINPISAPGLHELRRVGDLWDGSHCGLFCADGWGDLSYAWWDCGGRLSVLGRTHA